MSDIVIKRGKFNLTIDRNELIEVTETHDGISFLFKNGLQLYYTDTYMPSEYKQLVKRTTDSFNSKRTIIDLDNKRNPVLVEF
jgi:hypothetical protein